MEQDDNVMNLTNEIFDLVRKIIRKAEQQIGEDQAGADPDQNETEQQ